VTVSVKRLRNEESIEMLKIIKDTISFDVGTAYHWTLDFHYVVHNSLANGGGNLASQIEKNRAKITSAIESTMSFMEK